MPIQNRPPRDITSIRPSASGRGWTVAAVAVVGTIAAALALTSSLGSTTNNGVGTNGHDGVSYHPSLDQVKQVMESTASADFAENHAAYNAASAWYGNRLLGTSNNAKAPYLVCADYSMGRDAFSSLNSKFSPSAVHPVSNTEAHGSCFLVTASPVDAAVMLSTPAEFGLLSAGPFLPTLKLAPGLLHHGLRGSPLPDAVDGSDLSDRSAQRLRTTYGEEMKLNNVRGLSVRLSPGVQPVRESTAGAVVRDWRVGLMSENLDMRSGSFWSDPTVPSGARGHIANHPEGMVRVHDWNRAAAVVQGLAAKRSTSPGRACNLGRMSVRHIDDDIFLVEGIDHILPTNTTSEVRIACFMGLLSQLAARPEVLRVAPLHNAKLLNAVSNAIVQSATTTKTPLHDAGLDGTGETIQVVDTGLDETSCFFADDDGGQVEHGHLFNGIRIDPDGNLSLALGDKSFPYDMSRRKVVQYTELFKVADDDDREEDTFTYVSDYLGDPYQFDYSYYYGDYYDYSYYYGNYFDYSYYYGGYYDDDYTTETYADGTFCAEVFDDFSYYFSFIFDDSYYSYYSSSYSTSPPLNSSSSSSFYSYYSSFSFTGGFGKDTVGGHGTWTSGAAAGAISSGSAYLTQDCSGDELPACAGGCVASSDVDVLIDNDYFDIETYCPMYDCDGDGFESSYCLGDDPLETLDHHTGVAPGAQISMFDVAYTGYDIYVELGGNFVWNSTDGTGTKIHSNSWGASTYCQHSDFEFLYETFMYENPQNLLIFAAGNDGGYKDIPTRTSCTVTSPALSKNVLSVGATSAGPSRATETGADGRLYYESFGITRYTPEGYPWICLWPFLGAPSSSTTDADTDTVAWFSSYGPTMDGRIKPDVVAPGDQVFSASADGTDEHSCKLASGAGTSGSCPLVAGSAALVRQYFTGASFYASDVKTRRLCENCGNYQEGDSSFFRCGAFSPSATTVKAMLINSANLMGGSSEPDNFRGFGRVHLEAGMPMNGDGALSILVADSLDTSVTSYSKNSERFLVDGTAGVELRATLCWLDPPTTALSAQQLQHDLDLVVEAPSGTTYTMWKSGIADTVNVVERVIVPAASMESGKWTVTVSAKGLLTDDQPYSLVVTGAILGCSHDSHH